MNDIVGRNGWIGVDLDGTLAEYHGDISTIGPPLQPMVDRIRDWVDRGIEVKIVTARVGSHQDPEFEREQRVKIRLWLDKHKLPRMYVTNQKDFNMIVLYDDRAFRVIHNTGELCTSGCHIHEGRGHWPERVE